MSLKMFADAHVPERLRRFRSDSIRGMPNFYARLYTSHRQFIAPTTPSEKSFLFFTGSICFDARMAKTSLSAIVRYSDTLLRTAEFKDWDGAANGLQVENDGTVTRIAAATV